MWMHRRTFNLRIFASLPLFGLPCSVSAEQGAPPAGGRTDLFGDPLPHGVLARLGSTRFRTGNYIPSAVLSPDGGYLATAGYRDIDLIDTATGQARCLFQGKDVDFEVLFTPDGKSLVASDQQTVALLDAVAGKELRRFHGTRPFGKRAEKGAGDGEVRFGSLALSADGKVLAAVVVQPAPGVRLWEVASAREVGRWSTRQDLIVGMQFTRDGKALVCAEKHEEEFAARLREPQSGKVIRTLQEKTSLTSIIALAPDGRTLALASRDVENDKYRSTVTLWNLATGQETGRFQGAATTFFGSHVGAVAFAPDGKTLAWGGWDRTVHVCDVAGRKEVHRLQEGVSTVVNSLAFSPDGTKLYAAGDGTVRIWDPVKGKETPPLAGHGVGIESVAWQDDSRSVLTFSQDLTCRLWDAATGKELRRCGPLKSKVIGISTFAPSAGLLLTCHHEDGELLIWSVPQGTRQATIVRPRDDVMRGSRAFSPDGRLLAGCVKDGVCLWDTATGKESRLLGLEEGGGDVDWSADGRLLAMVHNGEMIKVLEAASGRTLRSLPVESPWSFQFSPNGRMIAAAGRDNTLRVWELASGKARLFRTFDKAEPAHHLAWAPDSRSLAWCGPQADIHLWDLNADHAPRRLRGHRGRVHCLAFSPDGKRLLSGSEDTTALIWDLEALTR